MAGRRLRALEMAMRNIGPSYGFAVIQWADRHMPEWLNLALIWFFTWCAVFLLPRQRAASKEYLAAVTGRRVSLSMVARHFCVLGEMLLVRMRVVNGRKPRINPRFEDREVMRKFVHSGEPALFGTFHVGHSDLLGFYLADLGRRVAMIRLRVTNSEDMARLCKAYRDAVELIWINEPADMLFAIKEQAAAGKSLAMQCDRVEFTSKSEAFQFLGARRLFPFTIFHLAWMFQMPVAFCIGIPNGLDETEIRSWAALHFDSALSREQYLELARVYFQMVLSDLESLLKQNPWIWFNFIPLNPVAK